MCVCVCVCNRPLFRSGAQKADASTQRALGNLYENEYKLARICHTTNLCVPMRFAYPTGTTHLCVPMRFAYPTGSSIQIHLPNGYHNQTIVFPWWLHYKNEWFPGGSVQASQFTIIFTRSSRPAYDRDLLLEGSWPTL